MITFALGTIYGVGAVASGVFAFINLVLGMSPLHAFVMTFAWPVYWPVAALKDYLTWRNEQAT